MVGLEEIRLDILKGNSIEQVLSRLDWKRFEEAVGKIFTANGFHTKRNFRFKTGRRYEVDVIATNQTMVTSVDCKEWRAGRYKKSAIKKAAEMQRERTRELEKFLSSNPIAQSKLKVGEGADYFSGIVTLMDEDVTIHDKTFIVPVWKLNSFINTHF